MSNSQGYGGDEVNAVVIDMGTSTIRTGFAGEDSPKSLFSSAVGVKIREDVLPSSDGKDSKTDNSGAAAAAAGAAQKRKTYYVGPSATFRREFCDIEYPVQQGLVTDWDATEKVWSFVLRQHLRLDTKETPFLLVEPNHNTIDRRIRACEIAFEQLEVPAYFTGKASVMATFASGRSTGVVLDSGAGHTTAAVVTDGFMLHRGMAKSRVAGNTLDDVCDKLIMHRLGSASSSSSAPSTPGAGSSAMSAAALAKMPTDIVPRYCIDRKYVEPRVYGQPGEWKVTRLNLPNTNASYHRHMRMEVIRDIKEIMGRVQETPLSDDDKVPTLTYELPDGKILEVGNERFIIPELLFAPAMPVAAFKNEPLIDIKTDLDGEAFTGVQGMLRRAVDASDVDLRKDLYSNIVVVGGNTNFPGFNARLQNEVSKGLPSAFKAKIVSGTTAVERNFSVWTGGSILGSLGAFHQMWMSRAEYEEHGAQAVIKRCP